MWDRTRSRKAAMLSAAALGALASSAHVVRADTWDNSAGSGDLNWSNPLNWQDDSEPASSDPVIIPLVPGHITQINLASGEVANSLALNWNYTLSGGTLNLATGNLITTIAQSTLSSVLTGAAGLNVSGGGGVTLNGVNNFSGAVSVNNATLRVGNVSALGSSATPVNVAAAGVLEVINLSLARSVALDHGGTLAGTSALAAVTQPISIGSADAATFSTGQIGGTLTIGTTGGAGNAITGGGGGSTLSVNGVATGMTRLMQPASYAGGWIVNNTRLRITNENQLGPSTNTVRLNGGILVAGATISSAHPLTTDNGRVDVEGSHILTLTHALAGAGTGAFTKSGTGTLLLNGGASAGVTAATVTGGILRVTPSWNGAPVTASGGAFETMASTLTSAVTLNHNGTLRSFSSSPDVSGTVTVAADANVTLGTSGIFETLTIGDGPNDLTGGGGIAVINVSGPWRVVLAQPSNYVGAWSINSGATLEVAANDALGDAGNPVTLAGGTLLTTVSISGARPWQFNGGTVNVPSGSLTLSGPIATGNFGGFTKAGPGAMNLSGVQTHGIASQITVEEGLLTIGSDPNLGESFGRLNLVHVSGQLDFTAPTSNIASLHVGAGQTTTLHPFGAAVTLATSGLSFDATGKLDVSKNRLVARGGDIGTFDGSAYTGVIGMVQSGYNAGAWDGSGIITSMSDAIAPNVLTSLVAMSADDANLAGGSFGGVSVESGDALVMYTWGGDANMDGTLNGDDYFQIDSNIALAGSVFGYKNGDFNYDGDINGDDYFIIDSNISIAQNSRPFPTRESIGGSGIAPVPEPACLAVIGVAALPFRRLRRTDLT